MALFGTSVCLTPSGLACQIAAGILFAPERRPIVPGWRDHPGYWCSLQARHRSSRPIEYRCGSGSMVYPNSRNSFPDQIFYTIDQRIFQPIAGSLAFIAICRFGIIRALVQKHNTIQIGILVSMNLITRFLVVV